jgi:hypothetical protein
MVVVVVDLMSEDVVTLLATVMGVAGGLSDCQ